MLERLQKIIAAEGHYSRRQAEVLIAQGRVSVDGKIVTTLGTKCDPVKNVIVVDGHKIKQTIRKEYLLFHKPRKCVVTRSDPEERKTIYDYLPAKFHHLKPVGRLDYDSEGLLLLTNDGELAMKMTHPRFHFPKTYEVKVQPKPQWRQLERLRKGIRLDERKTLPAEVEVFDDNPKTSWLRMVIREGRNRQIRRMCEGVGLTVKTLVRTQLGSLKLKGIDYGKWQLIEKQKVRGLVES